MKLLLSLVTVYWTLLSLVEAHIHSQKVRHIEREKLTLTTWASALFSSALVGICGVFPLIVNKWIKLDKSCKDKLAFKAVLSFAVGGLLGDVFLHLLPEAYGTSPEVHSPGIGLWVMAGLLSFLMVEKMMKLTEKELDEESPKDKSKPVLVETLKGKIDVPKCINVYNNTNGNCSISSSSSSSSTSGLTRRTNPSKDSIEYSSTISSVIHEPPTSSSHALLTPAPPLSSWWDKDVSGYLNLVANSVDNFTHGLAIAASYVASPAVGILTTIAILCHEIPHEVGDFAILLNSGFSLKEATKAQMLTACGGIFGVVAGLTAEHMSNASCWLLPFTAGGFLYIALVSIVPDLLECTNLKHSVVELLALGLGVVVMALVTIVEKKSCSYMPLSGS